MKDAVITLEDVACSAACNAARQLLQGLLSGGCRTGREPVSGQLQHRKRAGTRREHHWCCVSRVLVAFTIKVLTRPAEQVAGAHNVKSELAIIGVSLIPPKALQPVFSDCLGQLLPAQELHNHTVSRSEGAVGKFRTVHSLFTSGCNLCGCLASWRCLCQMCGLDQVSRAERLTRADLKYQS